MKDFLRHNGCYLSAYLVLFLLMVSVIVCVPDQQSLHLLLNGYHTPFLDSFFVYVSLFAEWPLYLIALLFILYRYSWTAYYAIAELVSASLVQSVKLLYNAPRPATVFAENDAFQQILVDGVHLHAWHSFPSGHSATFFVFFTVLTFLLIKELSDRKASACWRFILPLFTLILALLGGFSRVYLSQHFALDICIGSLIGVIVPTALYPLFLFLDAKSNFHRGLRNPNV